MSKLIPLNIQDKVDECLEAMYSKEGLKTLPDFQRADMTKAFYAGSLVLFKYIERLSMDDISEEDFVKEFESINKQLHAFKKGLEVELDVLKDPVEREGK